MAGDRDALDDEIVGRQRAGLVETADVHFPGEGNAKGFRAEDACNTRESLPYTMQVHRPSFCNARRELFTASESSIGNSGGITDVRINVHSRNNLYLLRVSSSLPSKREGRVVQDDD